MIHDSTLGPTAGGTRCRRYRDEAEMVRDGLRLAAAMTRKAALAGMRQGGGKVVVRDVAGWDRRAAFRVLGRAVEALGGRVWTGPDLGVTPADLDSMRETCPRYVDAGGDDWSGPATARTITAAMAAAAGVAFGREDLRGRRIAVQGCGLVGRSVLRAAAAAGARVVAADVDPAAVERARDEVPGLEVVPPGEVLATPCDILSPCAVGDVLDAGTVAAMRCRAVVPGANCVLAEDGLAGDLHRRGILYVPDYLANCGALVAWPGGRGPAGSTPETRLEAVLPRAQEILREAAHRDVPPLLVCEERVASALAAGRAGP
ncbi:MAG: hypothetical protein L0216_01145 [Planctomycetales bacterium]|nr:hypothetical protein [Planctomycetales bacterium]